MTHEFRIGAADWERLEVLWEIASTLPPTERDAMLRSHSVDDALREELESLLARASAAEAFFDRLKTVVSEAPTEAADAQGDPPVADPIIGSTVGHYRIDAPLGQGGMGIVYRATDLRLRRTVALKLLRAQRLDDSHAKERLLAEARTAASLDHANICTIYEVGETGEQLSFIAMGFYPGETLEQLLRRGPLPISTAVDYTTQIARGLGAAHQRGIVHRDVKPANVVVTANGVVKLLDFGIARHLDIGASHDRTTTPGTIAYMSPEQLTSGAVDRRSDLWSLGIVLYEMCAGTRPFGGEHQGAILYAIVNELPAPAATLRNDLPARVGAIIDRLLAKDPVQRYSDVEALIADLTSSTLLRALSLPMPATRGLRNRIAWTAVAIGAMAALAAAWPATRRPAPSERRIAAQDLYQQGHRDVLFRTEAGRLEALRFFRQAIAVDSTYATAHAGLAHLIVMISDNAGGSRREQLLDAEAEARTAIRLDDRLAEAHASLGDVLLFDYRFAEAEAEFNRAVELDPTTPYVREFLVWLYVFMDRPSDALEQAERNVKENPTSPTAITEQARGLLVNGRCNDAMPLLKRLMLLQPPPARAGVIAAQCYAQEKQWQNAIDAVRPVAENTPLQGAPWLGFMFARSGDVDRGREIRDTLLVRWRRGEVGAYGVAVAYAGLRDLDEAFAWLDKSIDDRSLRYNIMEPAFTDLRRDPRFDRIRQKLGSVR